MKVSMLSPWVTLGPKKDFYLNAKALDMLGMPDAVCFFFDSARSIIGIRKDSDRSASAFPVKQEERGSGSAGRIEASPFCTAFSIKPPYRISFQDIHVDADGILILDLTTATRINRRRVWTRDEQKRKEIWCVKTLAAYLPASRG